MNDPEKSNIMLLITHSGDISQTYWDQDSGKI